jgi:ribosomal protein S18 acetylase RimI-like enzyme
MRLEIRACKKEDLEALRQICILTYVETFGADNTPENMKLYLEKSFNREKMEEELSNPGSWFYFALVDGEVAGYLKLNGDGAQSDIHDPESLEVERIYIAKAFHGRSIGKAFLDRAMEVAEKLGKKYVWLGVWEENHKALRFYERYGFRIVGKHSFFLGEDEQSDFIMRKDIGNVQEG